ncbi:hypothetical protein BDQ17DRAFT_1435916 [Cyathus striatus]|nr:hypothetical protein BDQ17DRAFT_1435916 [Cyathus striatus]
MSTPAPTPPHYEAPAQHQAAHISRLHRAGPAYSRGACQVPFKLHQCFPPLCYEQNADYNPTLILKDRTSRLVEQVALFLHATPEGQNLSPRGASSVSRVSWCTSHFLDAKWPFQPRTLKCHVIRGSTVRCIHNLLPRTRALGRAGGHTTCCLLGDNLGPLKRRTSIIIPAHSPVSQVPRASSPMDVSTLLSVIYTHAPPLRFTSATLKCVLGGKLGQARLLYCLFRTYTLPIDWIRPLLLPRPQFVLLDMTEFQLQQSGHTFVGIFSVFDSTTASLHFVALRLSGIWIVSFRLSAFGVSAPSLAGAHHDTADRHGPASESVFSPDS